MYNTYTIGCTYKISHQHLMYLVFVVLIDSAVMIIVKQWLISHTLEL